LLDPYLDLTIHRFFQDYDHDQLSPMEKPVVRDAFAYRLNGLPPNTIAKGVRLQIGGGINELFETLLHEPDINRFEQKYTTVSALCQRWGREVAANPAKYAAELDGLPPQSRAHVRASRVETYQPYMTADVLRESEANKFNVVSTFAGGAGSSIGYRLAGGIVVLANDFVPEAVRTYRANFPDCIVDPRDIREISGSDQAVAGFLAAAGLKPGEVDILDGSPPCKEFSTAGRGIGDQDVMRPYSDVEQNNIASLPFDLADLVLRARPKVFVCENVPALASRGKEVLEGVLHALRFTGGRAYYADWRVLTASDFGVPQKRQRLFIIAVRRDVGDLVGIDRDAAVRDVFPAPTKVGVSVRSALNGLVQRHEDVWPWTKSAMIPSLARLIRLLPKNPPKPTRLAHIFPDFTSHYTLTRCSWDRPAPTMVVAGQQPDGLTGALHPGHDRKFTLPELKRLTGLPDDFVLTGTLGQASERICRMVPPFLTKAIAESVYRTVLLPYAERSK
jgi:DNA-cytosine methyltransferase